MKTIIKICFLCWAGILLHFTVKAQLKITPESTAAGLIQKLLGPGVTVSNVTLTGSPLATGIFNNISGTNIGLDSGIVLTNGRAKTNSIPDERGLDGDGSTVAYNVNSFDSSSSGAFASTDLNLPGDADLEKLVGMDTHDATVLKFDFVPLGDTIRFRYVFSSEEYPDYPCAGVNDAFAFFIAKVGIPGLTNIALVPGTTDPVTIDNINDVSSCGLYPQFYRSNRTNVNFTHNGHTTIFTATAKVQPCETYTLKLVIADVGDGIYDSGVFLEAGSLSSNSIGLQNLTQTDNTGNSYLVEGCATGSFRIKRPYPDLSPLVVNLSYGGTAINGVDVQLLPTSVIIPANDTVITVNVFPIVDLIPEGIESLKIYALAGCASGTPSDSTTIQIRDYDTLGIIPADTAYICKEDALQLTATGGYSNYLWDINPTLSSTIIPNPVATPVVSSTVYYCTATEGTCNARDSVMIRWRKLYLTSSKNINCKNSSTGEIKVSSGDGWINPLQFSINGNPYQSDSVFLNLPVGVYTIKIKDATGCIDSLVITITQLFPDLIINNLATTPASCSGNADGSITINASGGNAPYQYSIDGINFQSSNFFNIAGGNQIITVKDNNNCTDTQHIFIPLINTVTLVAGRDTTICEGKDYQLNPASNGTSFIWTPAATLSNSMILNPVATPVITTKYFITATTGICSQTDSVTVNVNPAPVPDAGLDATICYNTDHQLIGTGGVSYSWTPVTGLNDPAIFNPVVLAPTTTVIYYLSVIDANGCNSLKDDSVIIRASAPPILKISEDTVIAVRQPLQLFSVDVNNSGFNNYIWSPIYGLNNPFAQNPVAVLDRDITYYVSASNSIGCTAFDTVKIKVYQGPELYVPNAFTPNGDMVNDYLKVIVIGMKEFHFFRIYNRYGQLVFTTTDPAKGWDGKVNGKLQTIGTYVWMAEAVDYRGNLIQRNGTSIIIQ